MTQRQRRRSRVALGTAFVTAIAGATLAIAPAVAAADPIPGGGTDRGIGKHDEDLLEKAERRGERTVTVLVAGKGARAVQDLIKTGAKIQYREDAIGYVRAEVPVNQVKGLAKLPGIEAVDVDDTIPLDDPRPQGIQDPTPQPPPGADTPRVNPYMPTGDIGSAQFVERHPTWDGRGVTVGVVDTGIDLDHPALTTTTTGERKVVDWVTYTDGRFTGGENNDDDPTWLNMAQVAGPSFASGGNAYTAPVSGPLRFAVFDERHPFLGGELGNDVNRDGNPAGSNGKFGVLWDEVTNLVYVDVNQNKDFRDDKPMTDYKVRQDVNEFGKDNASTPVRESMKFVVQTDGTNKVVNIGIVSGAHGTHVAGIIAANKMFDGAMTGAAPGAKLVSIRACLFVSGCTNHALIEGMIYAARDAKVNVINMSIGGLPPLNDGNNARAALYNRLIDVYDVQMFISAGNSGAGANTVGDPSVADNVVSVGSYISKQTWQRNYGSDSTEQDNLHGFSSRGPREDGGFKPTLVAPGSAISPVPTWQQGQPVPGTYSLPPGYAQFNGTSMASPQAAGAGALLVSAARQTNTQHFPEQIRTAFSSSTRFIGRYGAYEQGNGLMDVNKAWNLLRANINTPVITSSVPVNTALSDFLATKDVGVGIYDREGVKAGDRFVREYTFTRHTGPDHPLTFRVNWVGNDGTFSSAPTVQLRKGYATKFAVTVNPRTAGIHSAVLNLDSPTTTGVEYQTLNTVVAAEQFGPENGFVVRKGGEIGRNQTTSLFVNVPANTPALKVDLQGGGTAPGAGQIRFVRFHPYGVGTDNNSSLQCYNPPVVPGGGCGTGDPTSRTVNNPTPGVWEIVVEARRTSDSGSAPYVLSAAVLGASVTPSPDTIPSAQAGQPIQRQYTLKNLFGPFVGRGAGSQLGSALISTPSIANGARQEYPLTVTPGSTSLRAKIGGTSDVGADLDLTVLDCTAGPCVTAGTSADGDSEEEVRIANPAAGAWRIVVDGYSVPAGTTTYSYLDVFTNPAFGSVAITDANAQRATGAEWSVPGTVTASTAPAQGRVLAGQVEVRTDANVVVGTGDVIVQSVTP
ncbi:subtilase family protein [Herbihabitans rhizosphaerae]|uniref:Subtilase family protein n=1 Tax=Herbihabitans rhizosphaerae TaxID=1872711 RepID=A0A4Q7L6B7_9PSEU|nr:S8 family serine peptidase [Herbihabitans rhizosphaerae]RZS44400.1 subtilase family protein [Herbihabitans rhizosphaerae]